MRCPRCGSADTSLGYIGRIENDVYFCHATGCGYRWAKKC